MIVDGIDTLEERHMLDFRESLRDLCNAGQDEGYCLKAIIFCRETLGRGVRLQDAANTTVLKIGIEHLREDIYLYVDHMVDRMQRRRCVTDDLHLLNEIKQVLKTHSAKM